MPPPHGSDPSFLVLHGLRVKGLADTDVLAGAVGLPAGDVAAHLDTHAADGFVARRDGRTTGWSLTAAGRAEHAHRVTAEVDSSGTRDAVAAAYARFGTLNGTMLAICTDWQLRTVDGRQVPNDHTDDVHDAAVLTRLSAVDDDVTGVCADLAAALARFGPYRDRFATARTKVEGGDPSWFTSPLIDSYHTVWFELHEDLLVTLGIERGKE